MFAAADNKSFRLTYGQSPIVRTQGHVRYAMDDYPNGLNAVVAVLSYTGYDMEDAMIINKASYDRGIALASVYITIDIDLGEEARLKGFDASDYYFDCPNEYAASRPGELNDIDVDGLPK